MYDAEIQHDVGNAFDHRVARSVGVKTTRQSPIEDVLERQGTLVRELHIALSSIESRLRPILAPAAEALKNARESGNDRPESLVARIDEINGRIAEATMGVNEIGARLQL